MFCLYSLYVIDTTVTNLVGSYSRQETSIQAIHAVVNSVMETLVIMTWVITFTTTPGQTHHPVIGYLYDAREERANPKPATRVSVECPLVDDDVFWYNMVVFLDNKLTEVVTRLYATNQRVGMGKCLKAIILTADVAKTGTHHK